MTAQRPHLVVATPCFGGSVSHLYMISVMKLFRLCQEQAIGAELDLLAGDALVNRARNSMATRFMASAATHLLFIDADIGFEPEAVMRLLAFDADLSGGVYPAKMIDWDRVRHFTGAPDDLPKAALRYAAALHTDAGVTVRDDFARARFLATGFMMIKRRVFDVLEHAYPELKFRRLHTHPDPQADHPHRYAFFDCMIDKDGYHLPEDYSFCERWTRTGGEIWVDLNSQLTHIGHHHYIGDARFMPGMPVSQSPPG